MTITKTDIIEAIEKWPGLYETSTGRRFRGMPVSQISAQLRECGWRCVPFYDSYEVRKLGLEVVEARYVGGVHPKRFCLVVVLKESAQ